MSIASGSMVLPSYASGEYYATHADPDQDCPFKAQEFLKLFDNLTTQRHLQIRSYADVGCGGGKVAALISSGLRQRGIPLTKAAGYDISPHVQSISHPGVDFYYRDFCKTDQHYDLVTLFDVLEHVPDPVQFLRAVAENSSFIALHVPLDASFANCFMDRFQAKLRYPGHLTYLDIVSTLNLITQSGLLTLGYTYTHGYAAPSGTMTWLQKLAYPFRMAVAKVSPWLASRTIGGVSLMVLASTADGLSKMHS